MTALQKKYPNRLVVLGINADNDPKQVIEPFMERKNLSHKILLNGNGLAMETYSCKGFPTNCWIDTKGRLVAREYGYASLQELERQLTQLLK